MFNCISYNNSSIANFPKHAAGKDVDSSPRRSQPGPSARSRRATAAAEEYKNVDLSDDDTTEFFFFFFFKN